MKRLFWLGCLSYFLIGLAHVVIGSMMQQILLHFDLNYSAGGQLIFVQFIGFLFGVLITPWICARLQTRRTIYIALISLGAAQLVYFLLPGWHWMMLAAPLAGFGFGMVETAVGAAVIQYMKEKRAIAMSRIEVFFGLGALTMPAIAGWLIVWEEWHLAFLTIGIISLLLLLGWKTLPPPQEQSADLSPVTSEKKRYSRKDVRVLLLFLLFFIIYVGIEMSLVNFMPSIFSVKWGSTAAIATLSVTLFWCTMSLGRIFAGGIAEKISYSSFLIWSCLGAVICFSLLILPLPIWAAFGIVFILGIFMSGMFAITLVFANQMIPGTTERTTSILIAAGGLGGAILPLLLGWIMDRFTVLTSILIFVASAFILLLIGFRLFQLSQHPPVYPDSQMDHITKHTNASRS